MLTLHHIQIQHKDNIAHQFHGSIFSWCVVLEVSLFDFGRFCHSCFLISSAVQQKQVQSPNFCDLINRPLTKWIFPLNKYHHLHNFEDQEVILRCIDEISGFLSEVSSISPCPCLVSVESIMLINIPHSAKPPCCWLQHATSGTIPLSSHMPAKILYSLGIWRLHDQTGHADIQFIHQSFTRGSWAPKPHSALGAEWCSWSMASGPTHCRTVALNLQLFHPIVSALNYLQQYLSN